MSFKTAAASVAKKEDLPLDRADAIIASGTRKASQQAVNANPKLARVPGAKKPERKGFRGRDT